MRVNRDTPIEFILQHIERVENEQRAMSLRQKQKRNRWWADWILTIITIVTAFLVFGDLLFF